MRDKVIARVEHGLALECAGYSPKEVAENMGFASLNNWGTYKARYRQHMANKRGIELKPNPSALLGPSRPPAPRKPGPKRPLWEHPRATPRTDNTPHQHALMVEIEAERCWKRWG